jgi:hypothetical protein
MNVLDVSTKHSWNLAQCYAPHKTPTATRVAQSKNSAERMPRFYYFNFGINHVGEGEKGDTKALVYKA